jgi:hypothetical protein
MTRPIAAGIRSPLASSPLDEKSINTIRFLAGDAVQKAKSDHPGLPLGAAPMTMMTIGHSTRTLTEFIHLLDTHGVTRIVDVRTVPRSRHNPQFNKESLPRALKKAGIGYSHLPGLGGLRHAKRHSRNMGWRNASFRGYADYMQTPEFEESLQELIRLARLDRIALMCAEALPWRCHRSLLADALLVRGIRSEDILNPTRRSAHALTSFARVRGTRVTYPAEGARIHHKKPSTRRAPSQPLEHRENPGRPRPSSMARKHSAK